jgi:hypothetical protein
MYGRQQKATEEQQRFGKGLRLSCAPLTAIGWQFTTSINPVRRWLPIGVLAVQGGFMRGPEKGQRWC